MMNTSFPFMAISFEAHWLFAGLTLFGAIAALFWLYKYSSKDTLKNVVWISLIIGIVGVLFTASSSFLGWNVMMRGHMDFSDDDFDEMMEEMEEHMSDLFEESIN